MSNHQHLPKKKKSRPTAYGKWVEAEDYPAAATTETRRKVLDLFRNTMSIAIVGG